MKKLLTIGVIIIGAFGILTGVSKLETVLAPVAPVSDVVVGDTIGGVSPFKYSGNMILPRVAANDFALGSATATSSAALSWDDGTHLLKVQNISITGTCSGCSGSIIGLSYIQVREAGSSFGNVSSLSFSSSGFNITNSGVLSTIGLDYTNGPASRSIAQTISGNWYFSGGASFSGAFTFPSNVTGKTQSSLDNSTKYATTAYVDSAVTASNPAVAVSAATTQASDTSSLTYSNGASGVGATLTGSINTPITIDGILLNTLGKRLLVKNDTQSPSGAFNGVYSLTVISTAGTAPVFTRASDYNSSSDINNTGAVPVVGGTANANTSWLLTSSVTTVGTDALTYVQFSYAPASLPLLSANNAFSATGSTTFAGSLNISKGVHATGNLTTGGLIFQTVTGSNSFSGSLNLGQGLHATGNVTTGGLFFGAGATLTGALVESSVVSNSFLGSLSGATTGTLSVGTSNNPLKTLWSNIVHIVTQMFWTTTTSTTTTLATSGEAIYNTASKSIDTYDGTSQRVNLDTRCFTLQPTSFTSIHQESGKTFNNPFTIDAVFGSTASPSGVAASYQLYVGARGSVTTAVFSAAHSASASSYPTYTTFAQATIGDGQEIDYKVTSKSANLTYAPLNICGHYTK